MKFHLEGVPYAGADIVRRKLALPMSSLRMYPWPYRDAAPFDSYAPASPRAAAAALIEHHKTYPGSFCQVDGSFGSIFNMNIATWGHHQTFDRDVLVRGLKSGSLFECPFEVSELSRVLPLLRGAGIAGFYHDIENSPEMGEEHASVLAEGCSSCPPDHQRSIASGIKVRTVQTVYDLLGLHGTPHALWCTSWCDHHWQRQKIRGSMQTAGLSHWAYTWVSSEDQLQLVEADLSSAQQESETWGMDLSSHCLHLGADQNPKIFDRLCSLFHQCGVGHVFIFAGVGDPKIVNEMLNDKADTLEKYGK